MMADELSTTEETQTLIDIHDHETLEKLWIMIKKSERQQDVFALIKLLLDSLPYDWIDRNDNWLRIAQQIDQFGESELANLFKLANQRCFQLSLK